MDRTRAKTRLEQQIDENLRKVYQVEDAEEAIPDRFMKLLQQLKEQELAEESKND